MEVSALYYVIQLLTVTVDCLLVEDVWVEREAVLQYLFVHSVRHTSSCTWHPCLPFLPPFPSTTHSTFPSFQVGHFPRHNKRIHKPKVMELPSLVQQREAAT